ncbi:MAG: VWA domain-containing protein, partial [Deltaproteobacteria bacterium]|nr:VWA domain-containing protein [Deltaproteobacteria bacterium]
MLWGAPYSFFLLLGALPAILFLHSLRPRGNKIRTAVLFLLERVLRTEPVGRRLGWLLKKNILLILQILIALLLIAALADPSLIGYGKPVGDVVVVVDLSASMKAEGRAGSRFEAARKEFLSLIDDMPSGQRIMVVGAGPRPQVLLPFTSDKRKIKRLIWDLRSTDAPAQVKETILFAHSFLRQGSDDRVVVFSDGSFDGIEDLPWESSHLRLVRVGGGSENVGIMAFEFRRVPVDPSEYEIMVSIKNFTDRSLRAPLTLMVGRRTLVQEVIEIEAQGRRILIYPYRGPLKGRATARLEVRDDFQTDNNAFLVLSESPVIRVLYAGKGNFFLEQLFRSFPQVRSTHVDRLDRESLSQQVRQYDVIVVDGIPSPPIIEGNFILINTVGTGLPLMVGGKVIRPRLVPWIERHPLAKGLRLENLYIKEAQR